MLPLLLSPGTISSSTSFDAPDVLFKQPVLPLDIFHGLADPLGHILPAVRGVLVVHREQLLEALVLLLGPRCHLEMEITGEEIEKRSKCWLCKGVERGFGIYSERVRVV